MNIIYEILNELDYVSHESFCFFSQINDANQRFDVMPFVSASHPSQAYLVVPISNSDIGYILASDFLRMLATQFRKQEFHRSDMDKNTTLLLSCIYDVDASIDHFAKVQIEDDPYYFKKYVFSCSVLMESRAVKYLQDLKAPNGERISYVDAVQEYLANTDHFLAYKSNSINQLTYAYFSELATKIPILPLRIAAGAEVKSISSFLLDELTTEPAIDINALDQLLEVSDIKEDRIEDVLACWKSATMH